MSLPKINQPIYELTLPSSGKKISYRPYLVKEDKILLMAAESGDPKEMGTATRQVVNNCVVDKNFDCDDLPIFDVDFIFMNIRAKSVGEKISQFYTCNNQVDDHICGETFTVDINIKDVKVIMPDNPKEFWLSENLGVKMKYPSYKTTMSLLETDNELEQTIKTLYGSIEYFYDKEQTFSMRDTTLDKFKIFVDDLTTDQFNKLKKFIENIPYFEIKKSVTCPKCGFVHEMTYGDPISFF